MRSPISRYDMVLQLLGLLGKGLFVGMFACTVLAVLGAFLGFGPFALEIYLFIWAFFWRMCITLMAISAIVTLLDGLQ
jgi:hypothetical protein